MQFKQREINDLAVSLNSLRSSLARTTKEFKETDKALLNKGVSPLGSNGKSSADLIKQFAEINDIDVLDNKRKIVADKKGELQIEENHADLTYAKYARQQTSAEILYDSNKTFKKQHSTTYCHKIPLKFRRVDDKIKKVDADVFIYKSGKTGNAYFSNLMTCKNVWTCPVCSSKISEHRKNELEFAIKKHIDNKNMVYMLTLTIPHTRQDDLGLLMGKMRKAMNFLKAHASYKQLLRKQGLIGEVRALETTWGNENGWHPHFHILLLTESKYKDIAKAKELFWQIWLKACLRADLPAPSLEHGVDLQDGTKASKYVSKWGVQHELTKWHLKKGNKKNYSPFQLLDINLLTENEEEKKQTSALFREYSKCFKGFRQLTWSKGLKDHFGVKEMTDEEVVDSEEQEDEFVCAVDWADWINVLKTSKPHPFYKYNRKINMRAYLLEIATLYGRIGVEKLLECLRDNGKIEEIPF